VRLQDRALCASITSITGTYAEPEGRVIFAHRHNADERMVPRQLDLSSIVGKLMLKSASSASNPSGSRCGGRLCLGGMRMPWPRPSGVGLPAQRQGPWRGVPAQ
jgi:hypothetical protein